MFVLMNNDLHVADSKWLRTMVNECLADEKVGIVGGKLLYEDGSVQHAGTIIGLGGVAGHFFKMPSDTASGYMGRALMAQEFSAVTAACLLIRADTFLKVGGLTEELPVAFNDVDLCLKVRALGQKIVMNPHFKVFHLESQSRGADDLEPHKYAAFVAAFEYMQTRWGQTTLNHDPFSHRYFSQASALPFEKLVNPTAEPGHSDRPLKAGEPRFVTSPAIVSSLGVEKINVALMYFGIVRNVKKTISHIRSSVIGPLSKSSLAKVQSASAPGAVKRMRLLYADIGPTRELGYPKDDSSQNLWANYHSNIWTQLQNTSADTVLVDGRFRIACFVQTLLHVPQDTIVLVHDFANRPNYAPIREFGREIASIENLSAFVRRPDFDAEKARSAVQRHSLDAH